MTSVKKLCSCTSGEDNKRLAAKEVVSISREPKILSPLFHTTY